MTEDKKPNEIADADLDVNGAGSIDALRVINELNSPSIQTAAVELNHAYATTASEAQTRPTDILKKING